MLTASAIDDVKKSASQAQQYQSNADTATQQQQPLEREQLEKVAQQLQDFMGEMNRSLQFQVDEDSGRDVIKVLDKSTGDVIKQYPSEEVLSLVSKLSETAGLLIDQTV
ncbi:flagellar protein FlaG [Pseudoalteromonas sp. MIP2626]|nr:flagellar protein FlaG [Pseudoalteromonas sp. MIP2626]